MKKTIVCFVIDKSGSMAKVREQTVIGLNEQIQQLKIDSQDQPDNEYLVCSVSFNGKVHEHMWLAPISELKEATLADYLPSGSTALYDAQGYCLDKLVSTTDQNDPDIAYLFLILTDGENTDHNQYSLEDIESRCAKVQATGKWTISYIGCSSKYIKEYAEKTHVPLANCAVWNNATPQSANFAFANMRKYVASYSATRASGGGNSSSLCSADAGTLGDYTKQLNDINKLTWGVPPHVNLVNAPVVVPQVSWLGASTTVDLGNFKHEIESKTTS